MKQDGATEPALAITLADGVRGESRMVCWRIAALFTHCAVARRVILFGVDRFCFVSVFSFPFWIRLEIGEWRFVADRCRMSAALSLFAVAFGQIGFAVSNFNRHRRLW